MPRRDIMPRVKTSHVAFRRMACAAGGSRMRSMLSIHTVITSKPAAAIEVR